MARSLITHTGQAQACVDYLLWHGANVYRNLGGIGQRRGRADITACLRGRYIDVEVKTGSGAQSEFQRREQARVEQSGGIYVVVSGPEGLEKRLVEEGLVNPSLF